MAKVIRYQLATERSYEIVVEVPLLDEGGNPVMKEIVTPVTEEVAIPLLDENGTPILDGNGDPDTEVVTRPVYDKNGEPVVEITYEPVFVEETRQEAELTFTHVSIKCATQAIYDANYPIAEKEAYNGEIVVEGEFDPEPLAEPTTDDILNALLGVTE